MHHKNRSGRKIHVFLIALILTGLAITVFCADTAADAGQISEKLIRFHVLANSDSKEDQALKMKVKDALFAEISARLDGVGDKEEARAILLASEEELCRLGEQVVRENGYDYPVRAEFARCGIDTRVYDGFSLPAGEYEALRIFIGAGKGKNWWCVLFPPLCNDSASALEMMEDQLDADQIRLIEDDDIEVRVKFKILEFFEKLRAGAAAKS